VSTQPGTPHGRDSQHRAITGGEVPFLRWFIHGNIITPETWKALVQAYGLCDRHVWVHLNVEMSFRKRHFLGPITHDLTLVEKSVEAIETCQGIGLRSPQRPLRGQGPCFLCALNISHAGAGAAPPTRLALGRDKSELRSFVIDLATLWRSKVGSVCVDAVRSPSRRRPHLLADLTSCRVAHLFWQQATPQEPRLRFGGYEDSFVAEANPSTDQHLAVLMSRAGWCGGQHSLLTLLGNSA
jgi:hypothetical protein